MYSDDTILLRFILIFRLKLYGNSCFTVSLAAMMPHGPLIGGCQCIPLALWIIGKIAGTGVCVDIDGECVVLGSAWYNEVVIWRTRRFDGYG